MTHIKNIEAFASLINFCTGYGDNYNPCNPTLQFESLRLQLHDAMQVMNQLIVAKSHYDNAVNHRKQAYDHLPKLASSILLTLAASGTQTEALKDARSFVHRINGYQSKRRLSISSSESDDTSNAHRSLQQLAYVSQAESFTKLIHATQLEPLYRPREPHLTREGLALMIQKLNQLNEEVSLARVTWSNAIIERNQILYFGPTSLYTTAKLVKKYVRAIFGLNSEEYRQIKNIRIHYP